MSLLASVALVLSVALVCVPECMGERIAEARWMRRQRPTQSTLGQFEV